MKSSKLLVLGILGLSLSSCATTNTTSMVECVNPSQSDKFKYTGFTSSKVAGANTLVLTSADNVVYYNIPAGSACRTNPENFNNND